VKSSLLPDSDTVFRAAGVATWRWNAASGIFDLSEDGIAVLEVREDELPLTLDTIIAQMPADDAERFTQAVRELEEAPGIREVEFRTRFDDGQTRFFRAVGNAYHRHGALTHAAGVILDITDQRRAEATHRAFFEQANGLHVIADHDGRILEVNDGWTTSLGFEADQLTGRRILEFVHPDDEAATVAELDKLSRGMRTFHFEHRLRHAKGTYRLIAWSASSPEGDGNIYAVGRDITEQRAAQEGLHRAAAVFNNSGEGILISDSQGIIVEVNEAFSQITGYSHREAVGQHTRLLRSGRHDSEFYERMWDSIRDTGVWRGEIWNKRKNGEIYPELLTITRVDGSGGGYVAIFADISKIKENEEALQRLAHYDQLTGLPNRYLIDERLAHGLRRAGRRGSRLAVIFVDIDSFKNVNDSLGHSAGDKLLRVMAERLRNTLRDEDNIGRIGGDEFLIVLEDISSADDITAVAEKIIGALRVPVDIDGRMVSVSASLGISLHPEDGTSAAVLMRNADAAMYSAKEQGRDTFRFYSEKLTRQAFQQVLLDSALREVEKRDELRIAFQIQRHLVRGHITGLEALLRWHHPKLGTVPPGQFIPHAERTGLIRGIGAWVLENACRQGARWLEDGLDFGCLAVNISPPQFREATFVDSVLEVLAATGFPAERLELEITENLLVRDTEDVIKTMGQLRARGIRFAIDDFGTGYSSLAYLQRMPLDRLKLDQSFVARLETDEKDYIIAGAVIALGDAMGLNVIAEGIERKSQEQALLKLGCEEGQGYLYGVPLYAESIQAILDRHTRTGPPADGQRTSA